MSYYIYLVNRFNLKERCDEVAAGLRAASRLVGRDFDIVVSETPAEAAAAIEKYKDAGYVITAVGGDGSINQVLNGIVGSDSTLAFVPVGTGNDFYRACVGTMTGGIYKSDIVRINDRYFINNACFGIDADIANDERFIHNKWIPRSMRFNLGVFCHFLTYKGGRRLKIECEGKIIEKECMTVVVANNQYYGGGYRISPDSRIDDGVMEVYICDKLGKLDTAKIILSMKNAGHLNHPALSMVRTRRLVVTSDEPFEANTDGEAYRASRFEIELMPKEVRLEFDNQFIRKCGSFARVVQP